MLFGFSYDIIARSAKASDIWRDIEVVITALTRNQVYSNVPRVRIPLSPPTKATQAGGFFVGGERGWGGLSLLIRVADLEIVLNPVLTA